MCAKPSLTVITSVAQNATRPSLHLRSPGLIPRSPISPTPASPSAKRFSSLQVPSYNYTNNCSSKSILKKHSAGAAASRGGRRIEFKGTPVVHAVTPIENRDEYYGAYVKLTREERRWIVRE